MRVTVVGPGRAGTALALAALAAGHEIVDVAGRRPEAARAAVSQIGAGTPVEIGADLAPTDLVILSVRDDAIGEAARAVAPRVPAGAAVVHLSGLASVATLSPVAVRGMATGSFHPLQTLPDPHRGAELLAGSWVAITSASSTLVTLLEDFADTLGCTPFELEESAKPAYHAAASAASNLPVAVFAMAGDLFAAAGVPFEAASPLVRGAVDNVLEMGPRAALTGPVARGDVGTVDTQLGAVASVAPEWLELYRKLVESLAVLSGRHEQFESLVQGGRS